MKRIKTCICALVALVALSTGFFVLSSTEAQAATFDVSIVDFAFSPQNMTIGAGDKIRWTNNGNFPHTSTSDSGIWNSGTLSPGQQFEFTFANAGSFPYHCFHHPMMTGTITVTPCGCQVNMIPNNPPVSVPRGGSFTFTGQLQNECNTPIVTDVWIMLMVPGFGIFGPIQQFNNIPLGGNAFISVPGISQSVPNFAPLGVYDYIAVCGDYPSNPMDSSSFPFTVTAILADNGADNWNLSGWYDGDIPSVPAGTGIAISYPNPFNAQTKISFEVESSSNATLEVYNLRGQRVETLLDGYLEAGNHSVTWDASHHSSGVYFYRLASGDQVLTGKMNLIK